MFGLIRIGIGCIFFAVAVLTIKRSKTVHKRKKYIISAIVAIVLMTTLAFVPVENLFITFNSPEAVYNYVNFGNSSVKLVVDGNESDLVIGEKADSDIYLIVPKNADGWKIGIPLNTKMITKKVFDDIIICVYQYKNTNDYFISIFDVNGGYLQLSDSYDSDFVCSERINNSLGKTFVTYYSNISEFNSQYWLSINGEKFILSSQ